MVMWIKHGGIFVIFSGTFTQLSETDFPLTSEAEHGYASTLPTTSEDQIIVSTKNQRLKTSSTKKATGSR